MSGEDYDVNESLEAIKKNLIEATEGNPVAEVFKALVGEEALGNAYIQFCLMQSMQKRFGWRDTLDAIMAYVPYILRDCGVDEEVRVKFALEMMKQANALIEASKGAASDN